jgi:hypothetical protein
VVGEDNENDATSDAMPPETAVTCEDTSFSSRAEPSPARPRPTRPTAQVVVEEARCGDAQLVLDSFTLDEATLMNSALLPYLAMVATVIEGRAISCQELLGILRQTMRQRSFDRLPRREYVLRFLDQHPP